MNNFNNKVCLNIYLVALIPSELYNIIQAIKNVRDYNSYIFSYKLVKFSKLCK